MKHIDLENMVTSERDQYGTVQTIKLPYKPVPENFDLYKITDTHIGNAAVSEKLIKKAVREIRFKKNSRVVFGGDQIETICIGDKRYDIAVHGHRMARMNAQRDAFLELFDPIADKVLWLLDGNHERKICNYYLPNLDIADKWNTVYANGTLVKAIFPDWRMASWHGSGSVGSRAGDALQRATNLLIALKRNMRSLPVDDCDIVASGHYHQCLLHAPESKLILTTEGLDLRHSYTKPGRVYTGDPANNNYRIHEEDRWWMCCGGFLRGYSEDMPSYTEDAGLQATEMGYGHVAIKKGKPVLVEVVKMV